ncbi:hypothetical protein JTE90_022684 [Oedothorax gibbosus]|uniref:Uncharacterized protein n=1 Tax=Oedothorax gibbosus TaxID=931172 RepID=A0AAV6UN08_9ARAC|nr:hypothetical protein JTE90_022684 [Oedothorax gibbosus]
MPFDPALPLRQQSPHGQLFLLQNPDHPYKPSREEYFGVGIHAYHQKEYFRSQIRESDPTTPKFLETIQLYDDIHNTAMQAVFPPTREEFESLLSKLNPKAVFPQQTAGAELPDTVVPPGDNEDGMEFLEQIKRVQRLAARHCRRLDTRRTLAHHHNKSSKTPQLVPLLLLRSGKWEPHTAIRRSPTFED